MNLRFNIDRETRLLHIYDHGVEEYEVEDVLLDDKVEDRHSRDDIRSAIGQTRGGRYLRVIYKRDPAPDNILVITAYELRGQPRNAYRRRQRRRGR